MNNGNYAPFIFNDHNDWCTTAGFTGSQAIVGCKDGSIKFWALDIGTLSTELCGLLVKNPKVKETGKTIKEWDKYIGKDAALEKQVGKKVCQ